MIKKALSLFFVLVALFTVVACTGDNTAELLQGALDELSVSAEVTEDLTLPTSGSDEVTISWSSDSPDVIANDGTVTRPSSEDGDATVVLTVTLTLGEETLTDTFSVTVLAQEPLDPVESLTMGYFLYSFTAEGYGTYTSYFHFYEDDPVLGAVFYYGGSNNQQNAAGTYTIEEEDIDWVAYPDRASKEADESDDKADANTGTAPYTITFYDFEGNMLDAAGYDGDFIYNDMENTTLAVSGAGDQYYTHDMAEVTDFQSAYDGEIGIPYVELVDPDDEAATLNINHDRSYTDLIGDFIVEGSWTVAEGTEGALEFTLTPTESYDTGAVLVLSSDSMSATYTPEDSTDVTNLEVPVEDVIEDNRVLLFEFDDEHTDRSLSLYEDGTYEFNYAEGTVLELGTFTYTGYTLTLIQEDDNEIVATMDGTSHALSLDYVSIAGSGAITATFTVESSVWGVAFGGDGEFEPVTGVSMLFEFTIDADNKTLALYDDGTWEFTYGGDTIVETGTFTYAGYSLTLTQSDDNEIVASMDDTTHALTVEYVTVAGDGAVSGTFTVESSVWAAAFGGSGSWVPEGTPVVLLTFNGTHEASITINIIIELFDDNSVVITQDMGTYGSSEIETGTYVITGSGATTSYDITVDSGTYNGVLNSSFNGLEFTYAYTLPSSMGGATVDVDVASDLPAS